MALIECAQFYRCPAEKADACQWRSTVTRTGGICPDPPRKESRLSPSISLGVKEEEKPREILVEA